ncbi:MAG: GNAT family N-acetyltransferase [Xanthobacteraceae bacterium]
MESPIVRIVGAGDEDRAIATIVLAFAADPIARWTWPRSHDYLASMPEFVRAFAGRAFTSGNAWCTDECTGTALWLPPGLAPDEETLAELMQNTVAPAVLGEIAAGFEQMTKYHPHEPHWYLPLIGVDPAHQGKGHGDALMAHALARCDRERMPAYLESTNPRNMSLYLRHGFAPLGTIRIGSAPPLVPMVRQPQ